MPLIMIPLPEDLIQRGWTVVPNRFGKVPGVKSTALGLTLDQIPDGDRFHIIVGSQIAQNRSGIIDIETDGPVGETSLLELLGDIPEGPYMVTPSGSIHRMFLWPDIPDDYRVRLRAKLLTKVDAPWQFLALDGENRVWHDFDLAVPELPKALYGLLVEPVIGGYVEPGEPYTGPTGDKHCVNWLLKCCNTIRRTRSGDGWNQLFSTTVYAVAGMWVAGAINEEYARACLFSACADQKEAKAVFEASWQAGLKKGAWLPRVKQ